MKQSTKNYKGFVLCYEEGIEKGLFFRNPIQKVNYVAYNDDLVDDSMSAFVYLDKIKKPLFRLIETLLGNRHILNNIEKWQKDYNWGGFSANKLCFPIYFKRGFRKLICESQSPDTNIQRIKSYGYESAFSICAGECAKEVTVIFLKNGKRIRTTNNKQFNYTYTFKVEEIIDTDSIQTNN